jgi:hypothetical protein
MSEEAEKPVKRSINTLRHATRVDAEDLLYRILQTVGFDGESRPFVSSLSLTAFLQPVSPTPIKLGIGKYHSSYYFLGLMGSGQ